jgi:superfamily I DNA/RNA helicase
MNDDIFFCPQFAKECRASGMEAVYHSFIPDIRQILEHGPIPHGDSHTPLKHIKNCWKLKKPPHRLIYKWTPEEMSLLRLEHRADDTYKNLPSGEVRLEKGSAKDNWLRGALQSESQTGQIIPAENDPVQLSSDHELAAFYESMADKSATDEIEVALDLITSYVNTEILDRFASLSGWPQQMREAFLKCETTDQALDLAMKQSVGDWYRLFDFLLDENPSSDIARLYKVGADQLETLASKPLEAFLLVVDEEQQRIINKPMSDRPFLVTGAAGTGKTIVGLYRMLHLVKSRSKESLFDSGAAVYRVVTYTNALVGSLKSLWDHISGDFGKHVIFSTADGWLMDVDQQLRSIGVPLVRLEPKKQTTLTHTAFYSTVRNLIKNRPVPEPLRKTLERLGTYFFQAEVEDILVGKRINSLEDYLRIKRRSSKSQRALRNEEKQVVWIAYEHLLNLVETNRFNQTPIYMWRQAVHDAIIVHRERINLATSLFIDEVQDLSNIQIAALAQLCKTPGGIILAADPGQSIYRRVGSWREISEVLRSPDASVLRKSYRMTRQISQALEPLRESLGESIDIARHRAESVFNGSPPKWSRANLENHAEIVAVEIESYAKTFCQNFGRFAILLLSTKYTRQEQLDPICIHLRRRKIPYTVHDPDHPIDTHANSVHILTAFSAKGMEFPNVLIPYAKNLSTSFKRSGLEDAPDSEDLNEEAVRLFYTACSRASETLMILEELDGVGGCLDLLLESDWSINNE